MLSTESHTGGHVTLLHRPLVWHCWEKLLLLVQQDMTLQMGGATIKAQLPLASCEGGHVLGSGSGVDTLVEEHVDIWASTRLAVYWLKVPHFHTPAPHGVRKMMHDVLAGMQTPNARPDRVAWHVYPAVHGLPSVHTCPPLGTAVVLMATLLDVRAVLLLNVVVCVEALAVVDAGPMEVSVVAADEWVTSTAVLCAKPVPGVERS